MTDSGHRTEHTFRINMNEIRINIIVSFRKMHLKLSSATRRPFRFKPQYVDALWLSDAIWRNRPGSTTLIQEMAVVRGPQAISWTKIDFLLMRFCGIHPVAISQQVPKLWMSVWMLMCVYVTLLTVHLLQCELLLDSGHIDHEGFRLHIPASCQEAQCHDGHTQASTHTGSAVQLHRGGEIWGWTESGRDPW